jgi:AcrR family transcriptional regulator
MSSPSSVAVPADRRSRKRLATRQAISDAATRLFIERGFDQVTVDEIAEAADVGRMTVFNHFPRKEDMFFDLDAGAREDMLAALLQRDASLAPIEALRLFAQQVVREQKPYVRFFSGSQRFFETIEASESLKARARAIRDELAHLVAMALAQSVGRSPEDPDALLAASLLVATWGTGFIQAHRRYQRDGDEAQAQALLLALIDRASVGLKAALSESPYV